jgi:GNAT superfamily N-acetyltransferase
VRPGEASRPTAGPERDTPYLVKDQEFLRALASNCGGAFVTVARAIGKPWRVDDDLLLADLGFPIASPPNNATLLRDPEAGGGSESIARRVLEFFEASPGGGFQVWSLWPTLDLSPFGFSSSEAPCMIREAGGEARPAAAELEIEEVSDDAGLVEVWPIVSEVFTGGRAEERLWVERTLSDDYRVWVGRVDGRPVTTATAYVSDGYVGIYAVGTLPDARGHGYGEALTWSATLCRPELPATLQASSMGRPVYERMGYRTVALFTVWQREDRVLHTVAPAVRE